MQRVKILEKFNKTKGAFSVVTDSFMEQVVKKTPTQRDKVLGIMVKVSAFALAMALIFTAMAFESKFAPLAIFLGILAIYFSFKLAKKLEIEYEYIFTNGELDIDKIIAQSKRKRLCSLSLNNISQIGIWDDDMELEQDSTMVLASDNSGEMKEFFINFKYRDYGETTLFFSPNDKLVNMMIPYLPREIRKEFTKIYTPGQTSEE